MLLVFNSDNLHIQVFLVTGGWDGSYLESTEVYNPSVGSWTVKRARLPRPMAGLRAAYIEDQVLIFGEGHFITDTNDNYNNIIFSGGSTDVLQDGSNSLNTILQYNYAEDEFTEVDKMLEERSGHAISVVKYSDYSQYCQ